MYIHAQERISFSRCNSENVTIAESTIHRRSFGTESIICQHILCILTQEKLPRALFFPSSVYKKKADAILEDVRGFPPSENRETAARTQLSLRFFLHPVHRVCVCLGVYCCVKRERLWAVAATIYICCMYEHIEKKMMRGITRLCSIA